MEASTPPLSLAPDGAINLQLHTAFSDGTWTPEHLIDYLVREQFGLVAITDHDRVDTAAVLQQLAVQKQLPLLAVVEMSTSWSGELTDVLCYGFDPATNALQELAQDIAHRQRRDLREIVRTRFMFTLRRYEPADRAAVEYLHVHAIQQAGAYLGRGPGMMMSMLSRKCISRIGENF